MAAVGDLIDFNVIESHKENIQALPSGRSAKALAQIYSPPLLGAAPSPAALQDVHSSARRTYEAELQNIDEADDPLDVYDRYVKWTLDAYPSAQATPQSQLLPLLERATKAFQSSSHYKNDPRYLKLWLMYIRLFSDQPRDVFVFLARHEIGVSLALYYEEFAAWLENSGRWSQAEEVYKLGIEREARPTERLIRKFGEFDQRNAVHEQDPAEPSSPALPLVRPVLAAKRDPFAASPAQQPQSASMGATKKKSGKMSVFTDAQEPAALDLGSGSKGWDKIESLKDRKKENTVQARPWAGEKLATGKTNGGVQKMMVFKDQSTRRASLPRHLSNRDARSVHADQCSVHPQTGRKQYVFVNLDAVYPSSGPSHELCFEELRAQHRGLLDESSRYRRVAKLVSKPIVPVDANADEKAENIMEIEEKEEEEFTELRPSTEEVVIEPDVPKAKQRGFQIFEDSQGKVNVPINKQPEQAEQIVVESFSKTLALNDENDENAPPGAKNEAKIAKQIRREERANRTRKIQVPDIRHIKNETKTIQLNMDSPTGPKIRKKRSGERAEPTMTINTKEAMDEIYGIFNQTLTVDKAQSDEEDDDEDEEDSDNDYTTGDESTATGRLSGPASEYGDETRNEILGLKAAAIVVDKAEDEDEDVTNVSDWSDFTTSKHVSKAAMADSNTDSTQNTTSEHFEEQQDDGEDDDEEEPHTRYVPEPPEGYEPPYGQYRDPAVVANNRLPFMTPIVEQTESSLSVATARTEKSCFSVKTPSRRTNAPVHMPEDDLESSPFQPIVADMEEKRRILQPVRTKSTKGTISLGAGSAKSQIDAKNERTTGEVQQKGSVIKDDQCNPMDPAVRETILARSKVSSFEGYFEHLDTSSGRTQEIKKYVRALSKMNKSSTNLEKAAHVFPSPPQIELEGAHGMYTIKRELGAGTFAPVYLVENSTAVAAEDAAKGNDEAQSLQRVGKSMHRRPLEAIKMEEPTSVWEFYMLRQCHRRLGVSRAAESIVLAHEMHLFQDECFLVEGFRDQGTLLDLVNIARVESAANGGGNCGGMEEMLAMWLTVEMLRTVEALHAKQLIHGDLKGDNVLVRFADPGPETDWSPTYFPNGAHGWSAKGVCLIDFGRGIDMRAFVPHVGFVADWPTSVADCAEMREARPWTYQIDYHGLAGVLHSLLFGKYMEVAVGEKSSSSATAIAVPAAAAACGTVGGATKTYRIRDPLKRYWQTEIWSDVFHILLNPLAHTAQEEGGRMPLLKGMKGIRERMESWLEENCERGVGLKGMVSRMEAVLRERRRRSVR